ncbi:hypothetical protein EKL29_02010 [Pantoea sp. YU22]|nr:hypothetical protein EKL29_02010 [Pantoea sp. YU22]
MVAAPPSRWYLPPYFQARPKSPIPSCAQQPEALREYFQERLRFYREMSAKYPRGTDPMNQKDVQA